MSEPVVVTDERRANPNPFDITGILAILYTLGYFGFVGVLFFVGIPPQNREILLTLLGLMSAIQMSIIQWAFGSSKNAEAIQRSTEQRSARTESTLQETIRAVPQVAAAAAGIAPTNGNTPVVTQHMTVDATRADIDINKAEKPKE